MAHSFDHVDSRAATLGASTALPREGEKLRILFLGNLYNHFSLVCLQTLVELEQDIVVGYYDPLFSGLWPLFRKRLKASGWSSALLKGLRLARCKTHLALGRLGIPFSDFASLTHLSNTYRLKTIQCTDPNSAETLQQIRGAGVDLIVVAMFSRIIKPALTDIPRLGCINVHPSLLPLYRGPEPCYWVLKNRESITGVTLHYMDEEIDSGDIILQRELEILPKETETTLTHRSARVAAELLRELIPLVLARRVPRSRQDHSAATYYSFASRKNGKPANVMIPPLISPEKGLD